MYQINLYLKILFMRIFRKLQLFSYRLKYDLITFDSHSWTDAHIFLMSLMSVKGVKGDVTTYSTNTLPN